MDAASYIDCPLIEQYRLAAGVGWLLRRLCRPVGHIAHHGHLHPIAAAVFVGHALTYREAALGIGQRHPFHPFPDGFYPWAPREFGHFGEKLVRIEHEGFPKDARG